MYVSSANIPSITRRLIDRYLMFGLACVFGSVSIAVTLSWRGSLTECVAVTAAVPLTVLLLGSHVLRRTVSVSDEIEKQLRQIARQPHEMAAQLRPLPTAEPVGLGWNTVLNQLRDQATLVALERRLSDTLQTSEGRRWEVIFNTLPDGVAVCDQHDRVLVANNAFLHLFGIDNKEQLIGKPMSKLLVEAVDAATAASLEQLLRNAGTFTTELRRGSELAAGVWRLCRSPMIGETLESGSYLWTLRDVTQQKLAEEMRNQFVFTATHELRTPLANIKAYAETLSAAREIDWEQQKGFYNIINDEATRLARFVDELLNVSQMEAGAISITRHETDMERLLHEVVEHVQPQIRQKELQFQEMLPPKLPKLRLDKDKAVAAIVNLLSNAVKYTPDGGQVRLLVEVDPVHLHLHVEDTGIGIAAEELPRLCEKFYRSKDTRVQEITGSGLGLAFSQEVARLHGGKLTVRSELNKGSRFTLSLPLN